MQRRSFALKCLLLTLTVAVLSACVNAPTHPSGLGIPKTIAPQLFAVSDNTTNSLDCLSAELRAAGAGKNNNQVRIVLGALPNTVGTKVGLVDLPPSLQPFVRIALDRITDGFHLIDETDFHKDAGGAVQRQNPKDFVEYRLNGSIYAGAPFRVFESEFQALGFGPGTHVEATDIGIQLYWDGRVSLKTFQKAGSTISMMIRVYSAEQGASAFRVTSSSNNGLVLARSRAVQQATAHSALQSAVNIAVGLLVKARALHDFKIASTCRFPSEEAAIHGDQTPSPSSVISVRLVPMKNDEICAVIMPIQSQQGSLAHQSTPSGPLSLEIVESRGEGIELRRRTINVPPLSQIIASQRAACFPRGVFDVRTQAVQFFFKVPDGRSLGSGAFVF